MVLSSRSRDAGGRCEEVREASTRYITEVLVTVTAGDSPEEP